MREYDKSIFSKILKQIEDKKESIIQVQVLGKDFIFLQYFLTRNFYYAVILDEYPFEITDKDSLLEALYYQAKLITVHDLNWDAMEEGLGEALNNLLEFEGICLLFKRGANISNALQHEFKILTEIIQEINKHYEKKIVILV